MTAYNGLTPMQSETDKEFLYRIFNKFHSTRLTHNFSIDPNDMHRLLDMLGCYKVNKNNNVR